MSVYHRFSATVSLYCGTEVEHCAVITGTFERGYRGTLTEPSEPDAFTIESVTIPVPRGMLKGDMDIMPILTQSQIDALEAEGLSDMSCLPHSMAAE